MPHTPAPSVAVHFLAGGIGAGVGATLTCPLELVKTRLQSSLYATPTSRVSPLGHIAEVFGLLRSVAVSEGVRSLWRGLGPTLVGVMPARAIYFATYTRGKHVYAEMLGGESSRVHVLSAATAGVASATATNPIWLVKTRMQLQSSQIDLADPLAFAKRKYKNSFHCVYLVVKEEGARGLYRGLTASFLGIAESTLQFVTYEKLKAHFLSSSSNSLPSPSTTTDTDDSRSQPQQSSSFIKTTTPSTAKDWSLTFIIAASSKLFASIITYPHEVLRTRLRQTPLEAGKPKYLGIVQTTKLILKEEGWRALYSGMTAHLMRVVPNAAIMFFCYEGVVAGAKNMGI